MKSAIAVAAWIVGTALAALPAAAHHSFVSVFDPSQPIEMTGTVAEVEWMNPHVWIFLDVENDRGEIERWGFELGSPNGLVRRGWRHDSLEIGQSVTISGVLARDESQRAAARNVTLANGESLFGAQDESR